ncbi:hypothetical protein HYT59_01830, partial [Candidatus Woesebacteria bacterium]|nr:hypothetical protein [Candidatus Woesebacteria bacterium]
ALAHEEAVSEGTDSGTPLMHMKIQPTDTMSWFTPENPPEKEVELPEEFNSDECKNLVSRLSSFLDDYQRLIVVPRLNISVKIALTAWGRIDQLCGFDDSGQPIDGCDDNERVRAFIQAFHNQGPEKTIE